MTHRPNRTQARYHQLAEILRRQIVEQRLEPGTKLPTVNELIQTYRVSRSTAVHALRLLVDEGLISQHVGRGTFVRHRLAQGEIAVVLSNQLLGVDASPYYRLTASILMSRIAALGKGCRGRLHLASLTGQYGDPPMDLELLEPDVLPRLRGVLSFHPLYDVGERLLDHGVPVVDLASTSAQDQLPSVRFDQQGAYRLAFEHLQQRGARVVGVISASLTDFFYFQRRWPIIEQAAEQAGVSLLLIHHSTGPINEQLGRSLFQRYCQQARWSCDAIVVPDEMLCRGLLQAAALDGFRFPQDAGLISFGTAGVPLPSDQAITRVELNPVTLAARAMACLQAQAAGSAPRHWHERVAPVLRVGETT